MSYLMRKLLGGYMDQDPASGSGGESAEQKAAREAAEAEAAKKKAEEDAAAGKKKPTDEEAKLLREVMQKKEALAAKEKEVAAATTKVAELEAKIKEFDGIDLTKVRELLQQKAAAEEEELARKGEWDKIKAQMNEQHQAQLAAERAKLAEKDTTIGSLQSTIADLTVGASFGVSEYIKEELTLTPNKARQLYGAHFEYKEGRTVAYDKPAGAKDRAPLVDAQGNPLSFDEALRKIVDADPDKDSLLKSKVAAGAGSSSQKLGADGKPVSDKPKLTGIEKIAAGLEAIDAAKKAGA